MNSSQITNTIQNLNQFVTGTRASPIQIQQSEPHKIQQLTKSDDIVAVTAGKVL